MDRPFSIISVESLTCGDKPAAAATPAARKRGYEAFDSAPSTQHDSAEWGPCAARPFAPMRLRVRAPQVLGLGDASRAEAYDTLYLTSRPSLKGDIHAIGVSRTALRRRFSDSPLAVAAAIADPMARSTALRRRSSGSPAAVTAAVAVPLACRIGADHLSRHVWPTELSPCALTHLQEALTSLEPPSMHASHARELLVFCEQHLLTELTQKMGQQLARGLTTDNVVSRFALCARHLHTDVDGAIGALASACDAYFVLHFERVRAHASFARMPQPLQAMWLERVPQALQTIFTNSGLHVLDKVSPAVLWALGPQRPQGPCCLELSDLARGAIEYSVSAVLSAVQDTLTHAAYARLVAADQALLVRLACRFDTPETLQRALRNVPRGVVVTCLKREHFALVIRIAQRGRTEALNALMHYLPQSDVDTLCQQPSLLPSALGCQTNLELWRWLHLHCSPAQLQRALMHASCSALRTAIRHDKPGLVAAYIKGAVPDVSSWRHMPWLKQLCLYALDLGRTHLVLTILRRLHVREREALITGDHAELLQAMLADGHIDMLQWGWTRLAHHTQARLLDTDARALCASAAAGGHDRLCLEVFDYVDSDPMHLIAMHPYAVALAHGQPELAYQMAQALPEPVAYAWAADAQARALRLAMVAGHMHLVAWLVQKAPTAILALSGTNEMQHRLLLEAVETGPKELLGPIFEDASPAWAATQIAYDDYALVIAAMFTGTADTLTYLLELMPASDCYTFLARTIANVLPRLLSQNALSTVTVLNAHAPQLVCAALQAHHWEALRMMLRAGVRLSCDVLQFLPEEAFAQLWQHHAAEVMRAALSSRRLGAWLMERCEAGMRREVLMAHNGQVIRDAIDDNTDDGDVLLLVGALSDADQRSLARTEQCLLMRRSPNVAFEPALFMLLARHLSAGDIVGLIEHAHDRGLNAHLSACPLAFEPQMCAMQPEQRSRVETHIARLLTALAPANG